MVPQISADKKERSKTIQIIVQVELLKNELTAYQGSTFSVAANNMSNFQTNMKSNLLERRTLMHQYRDFMRRHVLNN